ncbi:MAG: ankyrin repeat domain-containing protein [Proteobacteria bacterium]|nr:ankyrin repeat domain-containing protein [Pseudomonadota bacterium]
MSLSKEILKGSFQGVQRLLEKGAEVNLVDEYGYTPLIHATVTHRIDLAKLLLKYNANVNMVDISGSNVLHWAIDINDIDLCTLYLDHGANPNSYTSNGQPALFYPLLRNIPELINLLVKRGAKIDFAKDFILTKLVGHRFELKGNTDVINAEGLFISIDLEGFYLEFTLNLIKESLSRFINSYVARRMDIHESELKAIIKTLDNASKLREFKHFNISVEENKPMIMDLLNKDLLLLPVSYQAHAINYIKHGTFLAKCDRGVEKMTDPIVIYTMGLKKNLNFDMYLEMLYKPQTAKFIKGDLHRILGLHPYAKLPIKHQITGNCSWANTESSVPTMLYMLLHDKLKDKSKAEILIKEIMKFYAEWLEWDKDRALEDSLLDFDTMAFQRQKARAALLGAVLFQACLPHKPRDVARAQKILKILSRKEFHYIVRIYANVFIRSNKSAKGKAFQQLIELCGYKLSQFSQ